MLFVITFVVCVVFHADDVVVCVFPLFTAELRKAAHPCSDLLRHQLPVRRLNLDPLR